MGEHKDGTVDELSREMLALLSMEPTKTSDAEIEQSVSGKIEELRRCAKFDIDTYGITKYDFPLGCVEGEEEVLLNMFRGLISDESWLAVANRAPHLLGSVERAQAEVKEYLVRNVLNAEATSGNGAWTNRWRFDVDGEKYAGCEYHCPGYEAAMISVYN